MHGASTANLANLLSQIAQRHPDRPGVIQSDETWTWKEIDSRVNALASALTARGVKKGDKILVQSRNRLELFESCWLAFRLGCIWVPMNFRLTPSETLFLAQSSEASVLMYESGYEDHADTIVGGSSHIRTVICIGNGRENEFSYQKLINENTGRSFFEEPVSYDDVLWYFYTSGTTGRPKAAMLTHGQMTFVVTNHLADLIPGTTELDCSIAVAPLSHGAGIHALLNVARGAATVILPGESLNPELFWASVETYRVTNLFTVPTIIKILVEHPSVDNYDHSSLRYVVYAGAPMYRSDQKFALQKLGKILVQYFGLGEVTGCITLLPAHMHSAEDADENSNIGSCGFARTGMNVSIQDDDGLNVNAGDLGEICVKGPAVFNGYFGNKEATEKALRGGWFHTGDIGFIDQRGLLHITGRQSDMYISGGSNVYPREIEELLLSYPDVLEAAVIGLPDPKWGESGAAVIVCKNASAPLSQDALADYLAGKLAKYKWPRKYFFWDSLPKSGYGKVQKLEIKRILESDRAETEQ